MCIYLLYLFTLVLPCYAPPTDVHVPPLPVRSPLSTSPPQPRLLCTGNNKSKEKGEILREKAMLTMLFCRYAFVKIINRDNVAATLVGLLAAPNTVGKSITLIDGMLPVSEALAAL